jgi:CBS domain-containing protein
VQASCRYHAIGSQGSARIPEADGIMTEASARSPSAQPALTTAAQIMRPALTTVDPNDHVAAAAYLMRHAGTTALVVVDPEQVKRPVGLITEADVVQAVADGQDVNHVRIRELMTSSPTVVSASTSVSDAARVMLAGHFRHLPVVDDGGLAGMLDIADVCRVLLDPPAEGPAG